LVHQRQKKNQDAESAEGNEDGIQEQGDDQVHDHVDGEINAVEAFRVCLTSRSRGMSEVAKEAVVSPYTCLYCMFIQVLAYWLDVYISISVGSHAQQVGTRIACLRGHCTCFHFCVFLQ